MARSSGRSIAPRKVRGSGAELAERPSPSPRAAADCPAARSMEESVVPRVLAALREHGVELAPGLDEAELRSVEARVGARIPPDWRAVLAEVLPTGSRFPDWRTERTGAIEEA